MSRDDHRDRLRAFLDSIRRPNSPVDDLADNDPLVASGLIDSLAVVELILYLEGEVGLDFTHTGIQPDQLRSVSAILDLIEQHGK